MAVLSADDILFCYWSEWVTTINVHLPFRFCLTYESTAAVFNTFVMRLFEFRLNITNQPVFSRTVLLFNVV